jgi:hypothetical protein
MDNCPGDYDPLSQPLGDLRVTKAVLIRRRSRAQRLYQIVLSTSLLVFVLIPVGFYLLPVRQNPTFLAVLMYLFIPLSMIPGMRMRLREIEGDIQEIDYQIDLDRFGVNNNESRAEKVLRINELQLRRYYDLNLSQNLWVLWLGIVCIFLGVAVIATALYLTLKVATNSQARVITAVLGGVGAILSNAVAAIYLKMNASASESLTEFHGKLVDTNRLLLANLFAARIEDSERRSATLSSLAVAISGASSSDNPKKAQ